MKIPAIGVGAPVHPSVRHIPLLAIAVMSLGRLARSTLCGGDRLQYANVTRATLENGEIGLRGLVRLGFDGSSRWHEMTFSGLSMAEAWVAAPPDGVHYVVKRKDGRYLSTLPRRIGTPYVPGTAGTDDEFWSGDRRNSIRFASEYGFGDQAAGRAVRVANEVGLDVGATIIPVRRKRV